MSTKKELTGFATGWFVVAAADELPAGKVLPLRYFGRSLVAFRGESGAISILDAHCPHLGADLGIGGTVVGDSIRCPFHAWRFDGAGACVEIPYCSSGKIPGRAQIKPWPVRERNGLVFVWHDRDGREPTWEIPVIAEHGDPGWTAWSLSKMRIATAPCEIIENVADSGHFPAVHGTNLEQFDNEFVDHMAIQRSSGVAYPIGGGSDRFSLVATYYGPAYQITEMESFLPNKLVNAHTPIDEHSLDLRFGVMLKKVGSDEKMARYAAGYVQNLTVGFGQDVAIWENKVWRDRPTLCDGDGAIGALRRWYRQFYTSNEVRE
ncbi:MAG TPA: Rieske 2Fe-2S domain-containing protein [Kofleriaceae bacterium]|jgi:3-ketosteroid 9alpha-monooxygenase subunit A|nr:Rieske 2Fe-2S domain-containing protein [Kofleriaceae bacterium]